MGEQESFYSSNPVFIVIMRNSRGKLFVYVAVLGVLCFIVFLLSSTHTSLKELESISEKCQQQRDSLSAQLQVVYEHKNRLEKSLQQEKTDHRHTKEVNEKQVHELETKLQEEKDKQQKLETQITQLKTSYSELEEDKMQSENALKEQMRTIQAQKNTEIEKLQTHISDLLAEKDKLEMSNNAFAWKLEQHTSEINLCHLQHQQTEAKLNTCQEELQKHTQNVGDTHINKPPPLKKTQEENTAKVKNEYPQPQLQDVQMPDEPQPQQFKVENKTAHLPKNERPVVLEKPHVLPPNNVGDGVLPKPLDDKVEDAAVEQPDVKKGDKVENKQLSNHIDGRDVESKVDLINEDKKAVKLNLGVVPKVDEMLPKDQENHPQVMPPHNFDNAAEKGDHPVERGEYGQYGIADAKQQVEVPVYSSKHNARRKNFRPIPHANNDIVAAQMQDMMNKSPGDVNNVDEQNALHMPPQDFGAIDNKIREFKNADAFLHRGADAHHVLDDKNYEEDDDDRENDDEPINGADPGRKAVNVLQDNDFDDQENQDNGDNAKEEEGVVIAPK